MRNSLIYEVLFANHAAVNEVASALRELIDHERLAYGKFRFFAIFMNGRGFS